jgi:hypothetical protein
VDLVKEARDPTLARLEIAEAFKAQANAVAGSSEENDYWSAKGFPLWIEQAGDTAEIELISIISPITPFNLIWAPPAVPSIAYSESMPGRNAAGRTVGMSSTVRTVQLEKPESNVAKN